MIFFFFLVGEKFKDSKSEYILTSYSNFALSIAAASTQTQDIGKCLALWFEVKCLLHHPFQFLEDNLGVMSVGFLLSSPDDAVIWRGPKKNGLSLCFLSLVTSFQGQKRIPSHQDSLRLWWPLSSLVKESP